MDNRIFNVHTWSFWCVHIHTGDGHTDSESAQHFWLGKTQNYFLCSWRGSISGHRCHRILSSMLYQLSHPVTQSWVSRGKAIFLVSPWSGIVLLLLLLVLTNVLMHISCSFQFRRTRTRSRKTIYYFSKRERERSGFWKEMGLQPVLKFKTLYHFPDVILKLCSKIIVHFGGSVFERSGSRLF